MKSKFSTLLPLLAVLPALFAAEPTAPTPAPAAPRAVPPAGVFSNSSPILFREGGAGLPPYPVMVREETPPARAARMKWFHDARFGLFMHWGLYSILGRGEWV